MTQCKPAAILYNRTRIWNRPAIGPARAGPSEQSAADPTGRTNHLAATIDADIVKQKREGIELLNAIQDVYLDQHVTIA